MADTATPEEPKLPPKLDLRKQGILKDETESGRPEAAPVPAQKDTAHLVVPPPEKPVEPAEPAEAPAAEQAPAVKPLTVREKPEDPTADATPEEGVKRKTSRIPLETAKPPAAEEEPGGTLKPKTIKIKPTAPVPKMRSTQQLKITSQLAEGEEVENAALEAAKRQTSRIPLEAALMADRDEGTPAADDADEAPKTIKIKRPSEAATVKLKPAPSDTAEIDAGETPSPGETAQLDNIGLDIPEDGATQKKTIRVKRPSDAAAAKGEAAPAAGHLPHIATMPFGEPVDEPGGFFAFAGVAAVVVLIVVIYMFCAQVLGPNVSMTQLSYAKNAPSLPWPGKTAATE